MFHVRVRDKRKLGMISEHSNRSIHKRLKCPLILFLVSEFHEKDVVSSYFII